MQKDDEPSPKYSTGIVILCHVIVCLKIVQGKPTAPCGTTSKISRGLISCVKYNITVKTVQPSTIAPPRPRHLLDREKHMSYAYVQMNGFP